MSEPSYCEHRYRRDVETCPWCELAEAEVEARFLLAERDEAQAATRRLQAELEQIREERDEAVRHRDDYENVVIENLIEKRRLQAIETARRRSEGAKSGWEIRRRKAQD